MRIFCFPPARPGEGLVGTDPAPAGPLASAVICAGAAVAVTMINMTKVVIPRGTNHAP